MRSTDFKFGKRDSTSTVSDGYSSVIVIDRYCFGRVWVLELILGKKVRVSQISAFLVAIISDTRIQNYRFEDKMFYVTYGSASLFLFF